MPPHHWLPIRRSDAKARKQQLQSALGNDGRIVRFWDGKKKGRCYALVAGSIDNVPSDLLDGDSILLEDDDDLDDVD